MNNNNQNIVAPEKFTTEIKEKWLGALKSGDFIQGYRELEIKIEGQQTSFCCIGVLGHITEGLSNTAYGDSCPYRFLEKTIGHDVQRNLWETNDLGKETLNYRGGYENVIPLIEQLPTQD
jgi:hypothetical protein